MLLLLMAKVNGNRVATFLKPTLHANLTAGPMCDIINGMLAIHFTFLYSSILLTQTEDIPE